MLKLAFNPKTFNSAVDIILSYVILLTYYVIILLCYLSHFIFQRLV